MTDNRSVPDSLAKPPDELIVGWMVAIAASKDRNAFEQLYGHFAPKIKSYMSRQGADAASADDLTQETMVQVWRKARQYDAAKAPPAAWIFRIARNLQIDRLRRRKFHEVELKAENDRADEGSDGHERSAAQVDAEKLRELVKNLPAEQMSVVLLSFFEGLSHAEIGERLELPLGTVKSRLRLAFAKLRSALGD